MTMLDHTGAEAAETGGDAPLAAAGVTATIVIAPLAIDPLQRPVAAARQSRAAMTAAAVAAIALHVIAFASYALTPDYDIGLGGNEPEALSVTLIDGSARDSLAQTDDRRLRAGETQTTRQKQGVEQPDPPPAATPEASATPNAEKAPARPAEKTADDKPPVPPTEAKSAEIETKSAAPQPPAPNTDTPKPTASPRPEDVPAPLPAFKTETIAERESRPVEPAAAKPEQKPTPPPAKTRVAEARPPPTPPPPPAQTGGSTTRAKTPSEAKTIAAAGSTPGAMSAYARQLAVFVSERKPPSMRSIGRAELRFTLSPAGKIERIIITSDLQNPQADARIVAHYSTLQFPLPPPGATEFQRTGTVTVFFKPQ